METQKKKCLIIDEMHPSIVPMLENLGFWVEYVPVVTKLQVPALIGDCTCLVVRSKLRIEEALLDKAHNLKYIVRAGAGIDNLDLEAIGKRGIKVINAPEGNRDAVGEHALGMLLALFNNIIKSTNEIRKGTWDREGNRGTELMGKTVGLIGYGNMGMAFAKKLASFDCEVLAYDKYKHGFQSEYAVEASMDVIFEKADILSLHVPLTGETRGLVDEDYLQRFQKSIYIINTARGGILSLKAVVAAIEQGKVKGAALDVLENEKLDTLNPEEKKILDFLSHSDKVVLTPHVAGWTYESYKKINEVLISKLENELLSVN